LDTGAAISVVGGNLAKQIIQSKHPVKPVATAACTADGKRQEVVGRFRTPVQYKGVVEDSDSPCSSPVVLVQKPGKVRLCLDSRKVHIHFRRLTVY